MARIKYGGSKYGSRINRFGKYLTTAAAVVGAAKKVYQSGKSGKPSFTFGMKGKGRGRIQHRIDHMFPYAGAPTTTLTKNSIPSRRFTSPPGYGPRRVRKVKRVPKDMYVSKGFKNTVEINGLVTDPDCLYLAHSALSGEAVIECAVAAMLRKLILKATGWNCPGIDVELPTIMVGDTMTIYRVVKSTGVESNFPYIIQPLDTIRKIIGNRALSLTALWVNLMVIFRDYAESTNLNNMQIDLPTRIVYNYQNSAGVQIPHRAAEIMLQNERIHLYAKSDIKFQNRTLSADADNDADAVSANPITGFRYKFSGGVPKARNEGIHFLETMNDYTGVITQRGASFTQPGMKEPPIGSMFSNCLGTSKVTVQPGEIRKSSIKHSESKSFHTFFQGLGYGVTGTGMRTHLRGKSEMFALEDVINFNGAQLINLAYEVNRLVGCYWTTHNQRYAVGAFDQLVQSNP